MSDRYARHVALREVGAEGQEKLGATRMLIVGLGGLGCPAAQYLAASGVGALLLNDFDRVDLSNLPRQILFSESDIGRNKVDAAASRLGRLNPDCGIECLAGRLDDAQMASVAASVDIVLDCTDNFTTRLAINRASVAAGRPLVSGAALRFEGQIAVFAGRPCYRCVYSEEDEMLGNCAGNGVLAPVPGVVGCLMAVEAMKLAMLGETAQTGKLTLWDAISGGWQTIRIAADPECPVCGRTGP